MVVTWENDVKIDSTPIYVGKPGVRWPTVEFACKTFTGAKLFFFKKETDFPGCNILMPKISKVRLDRSKLIIPASFMSTIRQPLYI